MKQELQFAKQAALQAGKALLSFYQNEYEVKSKGVDNPLTEADEASDRILKSLLLDATPDYGWLSEETVDNDDRLQKERVWIVDPLDGTKEFIQGVPQFTVSIGLAEQGKAKLGVIYNPVTKELFSGIVGEGAWLNDAPMHTSTTTETKGATILASRSEMKRGEFDLFQTEFNIEAIGSIAYKLALVAAGKADTSFSLGPKHEWDICAGVALVEAAGGIATARDGSLLVFNQKVTLTNGITAANAHIHQAIINKCVPILDQFEHRFHERK